MALDIAPEALALAGKNVEALGLGDRVEVCESDLLSALDPGKKGSFDLIVSNPPYVPTKVCDNLPREVSEWDPRLALDGGEDGLDLFRRFLPDALSYLKPGGVLAVELFEGHLDQAFSCACDAGFEQARIAQDLTGRPRVLVARKPR